MSTLTVQTITGVSSFDFSNTSFASAYGVANSGYTVANSAFAYGNSSYTVANAAFGKANNALPLTGGTINGTVFIPHTGILSGVSNTTINEIKFGNYGFIQHTSYNNVPFIGFNARLVNSDYVGSGSGTANNRNIFTPMFAAGGYTFITTNLMGDLLINTGRWNNASNANIDMTSSTMTIDAYGRVTIPFQPRFHAKGLNTLTNNSDVIYPTTVFNVGSYYNTTTGRFTAPVSGCYMFGWTSIGGTPNDVYRWRFRINGSNVGDVHLRQDTGATGSEYATNGFFVIPWNLTAGDYVNIFYGADSSTLPYANGNATDDYPRFWGYLLS